ncbi:MAG: guanylate kinase [Ruminococcus sp.]|jgi:guanylate kinase
MGKIFYIMGKSASGKDSIYQRLLEKNDLGLKKIILYTTRPIRDEERQGREYFFVDEEKYRSFEREGRLIEARSYETVHGIWIYFTADDGQIDLKRDNFLAIGTLESYEKMKNYFGQETICPIYVEVEDGERLCRALLRERKQEHPRYAEMCRRFLADEQDFSEENIKEAGIGRRFINEDGKICLAEIESYIKDMLY